MEGIIDTILLSSIIFNYSRFLEIKWEEKNKIYVLQLLLQKKRKRFSLHAFDHCSTCLKNCIHEQKSKNMIFY